MLQYYGLCNNSIGCFLLDVWLPMTTGQFCINAELVEFSLLVVECGRRLYCWCWHQKGHCGCNLCGTTCLWLIRRTWWSQPQTLNLPLCVLGHILLCLDERTFKEAWCCVQGLWFIAFFFSQQRCIGLSLERVSWQATGRVLDLPVGGGWTLFNSSLSVQ